MKMKQTRKFNDNSISIRTIFPLQEETITKINLFVYMMKAKTEKYDTKQKLSMALSSAYGTRASFSICAYGKQVVLDCRFRYIKNEWIQDPNYLNQVMEIMDQILFHSVFDEDTLQESKFLYQNRLMSQLDDPDAYSMINALSIIDIGHNISIRVQGKIEDLDSITLDDMNELLEEYKKKDHYVYTVGDLEESVTNYLKNIDTNKEMIAEFNAIQTDQVFHQIENRDIAQTNMTQIYATDIVMDDVLYYPMLMANSLLGSCPNNLLFQEVREKNSLCYSIHSSFIRFDGALCVHLATRWNSVKKAEDLIQTQIKRLQNQEYDPELLKIAKKDFVDGLRSMQDHPFSIIEQMFLDDMLHRVETIEDRIQKINQVSMEDIAKASHQWHLVSTFYLRENENEL